MTNPVHETRAQQTREAKPVHNEYDDINFDGTGLLDTKNIPARPGYVQRWVRTKLRGDDDQSNIAQKLNHGWRPRPLDTVAKGAFVPKVDFNGVNVIGIHGMILMERPQSVHDRQAEYIRNQTESQMRSVEENIFKVHQEGSGLTRPKMKSSTSVTKGSLIDDDDE